MGLYDRDYVRSSQTNNRLERIDFGSQEEAGHVIGDINAFVKTTYSYFAASLVAGTAGAYAGMQAAATIKSFYWPLVILEIALIIGLHFVRNKPGINAIVLFAFTFISGLTLTPLLSNILNLPSGAGIITNAFLMTSVAFGGLTMFAMNTKKDFTMMGKMLFIALIVMIVAGVINIFLGSPILQLMLAGAGALLFSFFILYDTQNIIKGAYDSPVSAAASLYLDFLNLFVSLLQILGIFGGKDE